MSIKQNQNVFIYVNSLKNQFNNPIETLSKKS